MAGMSHLHRPRSRRVIVLTVLAATVAVLAAAESPSWLAWLPAWLSAAIAALAVAVAVWAVVDGLRLLRWLVSRCSAASGRARAWSARHPWLATLGMAVAGVVAVVVLLVVLLGPLAGWMGGPTVRALSGKDKADAVNAVRQTLLAAVGGAAVLVGLGFTVRTFYLSRRGQLTDRYTKAIGQLAVDGLAERLGGVYALEHLMVESARDHQTVVDVLAAFVRERAPATPADAGSLPDPPVGDPPHESPRPATDVQAALTVLGRRPERLERHPVDLRATDLRGAELANARLKDANLRGAQLQGANLWKTQLQGANLSGAQLQGAILTDAQLQGAILLGAQLQGAILLGAQLQGANLTGAQLQGANLSMAQLQDAYLEGADLEGASLWKTQLQGAELRESVDLTVDQLCSAELDKFTELDEPLRAALQQANTGEPPTAGPAGRMMPR